LDSDILDHLKTLHTSAIDARNGAELWREQLAAPAHSIPSTYLGKDGKQYVAVPAGGGGFLRSPTSDAVIAWRIQ